MKRKKIWMIPPNILFICSMTSLVACNNKVTYSQLKENFNKQKEKFHSLIKIENKKFSSGDPVNNAINNYFSLLKKNDKTLENKKEINKKEYFTENENESRINNEDSELLQQLIEEEKQQKEELKKQKIITISLTVSGSILAGVAAGLSIYFGTKNIDSEANIERKILENNFYKYKELVKNSEKIQSLFDIFNKIIDSTFEEELPRTIIVLLREVFFQEYLQDFDKKSEDILIKKLSEIQIPIKNILKKIFDKFAYDYNFFNDNEQVNNIKKIKELVVEIAKIYLPNALRNILDFLTLQSESDNKSSILARIVIKIMKKNNIIVEDVENISEVFKVIVSILINQKKTLLNFIIDKIIDTLSNNELLFDIKSDFFNIINKTIEKLFACDNENDKLSLEKIFKEIIPKIIEFVQIDKENSYESFVKFINNLFTKEKNKKKWIYLFLKSENIIDNSEVYLQKEFKKNNKIYLPKFNITLNNIFLAFENRENIETTINGITQLLFEPIIIEISKNNEKAKKSIFRLILFLSFIFYKYAKINNKLLDKIFHFLNPFEPETYLVEIIKKLLKKWNINIQIEEILGIQKIQWWKPWSKIFEIFKTIKNAAENKNNSIEQFIKLLENGCIN
ncbi:hypothetical protein [Mycoplasma phocimorsus]|uniref:hypothetical protein n=1 Tax=Mycoplasma phocimorsus TaxID=3045839 RepID=UPI0024BFC09F|nr:hypothetical protein [Mycoplasma phocimorsus]MDJ1647624.1 hypothetical protein [Mycoplasma phocimorsus]